MTAGEQGLLSMRSDAGCSRRTFLLTALVGALAAAGFADVRSFGSLAGAEYAALESPDLVVTAIRR